MRSETSNRVPHSSMPPKQLRNKKPNLDSLTTVNADGSRYFLHPSDVSGRFTTMRRWFGWLLIAVYVLLPWMPINGAPALFLDVENRRFHLFGLTLLTQDMWVFFFALSGMGFALFFITAILGRLWCGWACPYTVFLEHVFRRVERWIDGDAPARRTLDAAPNNARKIIKRTVKWTIYTIISAAIAHVFISYFVSVPRLYEFMMAGPKEHMISFGVVFALTGILLFCFAWFREQFCIILCPYGRIQSALTDDDTVVIGYDEGRGEPRGKASDPSNGHCIDCFRCVQVCPTGIDIRNGLQLECIGCAACIDACDDIMRKLDRPTGLVRYDSTKGLQGLKRRVLRPRLWMYAALGLLGLSVLGATAFFKARPIHAEVSRMRGAPYFHDETVVRNHYQTRLINKRNQPVGFTLSLEDAPTGFTLSGVDGTLTLGPLEEAQRPLVILVGRNDYTGPVNLTLRIDADPGGHQVRQKIRFLGPAPR